MIQSLTRDGFSPPLIGFASNHSHTHQQQHHQQAQQSLPQQQHQLHHLIMNNSNNNNNNNNTMNNSNNNNNKGITKPSNSVVELRGSFESIKRIAGHREVRFMESQEQPLSRLRQSYEKYKSTDSLVIDMSLVGEDCESSRSSPSTSERHGDSTFSPSTTNPPTSGNFFHGSSKTQTSSEFSTINTNFHDYSAGSEQSSFEFIFDLENEAEEKLKTLLDELDEKLYGFSPFNKQASPKAKPSTTQRNKRKNRLKENDMEKITMEKIATQWSKKFPHFLVTSTTIEGVRPDSSFDIIQKTQEPIISPSHAVSPFGGQIEEVIAEDGDYEETLVMDIAQKKLPHPLGADSFLNKSTPNFRANKKKTPRETPQSPQSIQFAERIKVQLNKGFPPIEAQSAVFYEAQWEVFDSIWKSVVPKIMSCFKQYLIEENVERKKRGNDKTNVDVVYINDNYGNHDKLIDELEDIDEEDSDQDRAFTPYSAVSTASSSSSNSRKILKLGTPTVRDRQEKRQELNHAVLISPFHPKPRRNSSYFNLAPNGMLIKAHEKPSMPQMPQEMLSRENSSRNLEIQQQHPQKQFPVRHNQHFTGGFRPNPINQQHNSNVVSTSNNNPKPLIQKIKVDQSSDRAQTAMPSSFNKLIILENDSKSNLSKPQPTIITFQNSSRPQTQSQFAKKNPSLANIFNSDVNNVHRMEQYDQGMIRRNEISSPSVGNTTVTYQTKRKLPKQTKPREPAKR